MPIIMLATDPIQRETNSPLAVIDQRRVARKLSHVAYQCHLPQVTAAGKLWGLSPQDASLIKYVVPTTSSIARTRMTAVKVRQNRVDNQLYTGYGSHSSKCPPVRYTVHGTHMTVPYGLLWLSPLD